MSKLREVLEEKKKAAEKRYQEHQNLEEEETLKKAESTLIPETENVLENVSGIEMASEPVSNQSQESALETVPKSEQSQSVTDDAEQEEQRILDTEAPISYDRLVKKTLRTFHIVRSSPQTLEVTDKAMKKVSARLNKQAGVKFYWRKDQDPERYAIYRIDEKGSDKRSVEEICQQEMKNAVCVALQEKGVQSKEELLRNTIRVMGYSRSSTALLAAAERGLKYGRKTGEIIMNEEKNFILNQDNEMDSGRM